MTPQSIEGAVSKEGTGLGDDSTISIISGDLVS